MTKSEEDSVEIMRLRKEIWEKAVDTQMHFNEMSVKSRQLGLSFVVAALGVAVVLLTREGEGESLPLISLPLTMFGGELKIHVSAVIVMIAAAGLYAVRVLDLNVYHRMLRGAVAFGEELEQGTLRTRLMATPKGMTELISLYSRYKTVERQKTKGGSTYKVDPKDYFTAENKIQQFYRRTLIVLFVIAIALTVIFGHWNKIPGKPAAIDPMQESVDRK